MKNIVWKRPDGGISVTHVIHDDCEAEAKKLLERGDIPADYTLVGFNHELPNRDFRNAWCLDNDKIGHDMVKARALHLQTIRSKRDAKLKELDLQFMRALESGQDTKEIAKKKQDLRDLPQTVSGELEAALTCEDLKKIDPVK